MKKPEIKCKHHCGGFMTIKIAVTAILMWDKKKKTVEKCLKSK